MRFHLFTLALNLTWRQRILIRVVKCSFDIVQDRTYWKMSLPHLSVLLLPSPLSLVSGMFSQTLFSPSVSALVSLRLGTSFVFSRIRERKRKKKIKTITGQWSKRRLKTNSWITRWQSSLGPSSWEDGLSKLLFYWSRLTRISRGFRNKTHLIFVTQLIGQRQVQNSCFIFFPHIRVKSFYGENFRYLF